MQKNESRPLAIGLMIVGALIRVTQHWNFAPVGAMSLFAGARLRGWKAYAQFESGNASTSTAGGALGIIQQAIAKEKARIFIDPPERYHANTEESPVQYEVEISCWWELFPSCRRVFRPNKMGVSWQSNSRLSLRHNRFMMSAHPRITIEPDKRDGKPCIRGMRITVNDVLGWLSHGMTEEELEYTTGQIEKFVAKRKG